MREKHRGLDWLCKPVDDATQGVTLAANARASNFVHPLADYHQIDTQPESCTTLLYVEQSRLNESQLPKLGWDGEPIAGSMCKIPVTQHHELARDSYVRLGLAGLRPPTRDARRAAPASTPSSTRLGM